MIRQKLNPPSYLSSVGTSAVYRPRPPRNRGGCAAPSATIATIASAISISVFIAGRPLTRSRRRMSPASNDDVIPNRWLHNLESTLATTINAELAEPAETRGVRLQADFFLSGCRLRAL